MRRRFVDLGYRAAVLANRQPILVVPRPGRGRRGATLAPPPAWWKPVAVLELGHNASFDAVFAISARAPEEGDLLEAIDLLGSREAIAMWPTNPCPVSSLCRRSCPLSSSSMVPNGTSPGLLGCWTTRSACSATRRLLSTCKHRPSPVVRMLHCWSLIDSLDPAGCRRAAWR